MHAMESKIIALHTVPVCYDVLGTCIHFRYTDWILSQSEESLAACHFHLWNFCHFSYKQTCDSNVMQV